MNAKQEKSGTEWVDRDDAPEWTVEMLDRAELSEKGKVLRPATGTIARGGGRPALEHPKERVTLRLDHEIAAALRASGKGWQTRVNEVLKEWLARGRT